MEEKRRFPRLDMAVDVLWKKVNLEKASAGFGDPNQTRNISEGGICLIVYDEVNVGDQLSLDIRLPTQQVIHAVGRVVWSSPFELITDQDTRKRCDIGIEFLQIAPQDKEEIKEFVLKRF
jgi:c-di-GMP-binding flagellar brake protein YcgR